MYQRKTKDEYTLLGNYGHGWEELTSEDSRIEILKRLREYKENDYYSRGFKIIKKRVKKV